MRAYNTGHFAATGPPPLSRPSQGNPLSETPKEAPPGSGGTPEKEGLPPRRFRMGIVYLILFLILLFAAKPLLELDGKEASYDEFLYHLRAGHIQWLSLGDDYHRGEMFIPAGSPLSQPPGPAELPGAGGTQPKRKREVGGNLEAGKPIRFYVG